MKKPTDEGRLGVLSLLDRPTGDVGIELGVAAGPRRVVAAPIKRFLGGGGVRTANVATTLRVDCIDRLSRESDRCEFVM